MTRELLSEEQDRVYREDGEIDFAYGDVKSGRFRCNYFKEHWGAAAVYRRIPVEIPTLKELNLPASLESLIHLRGGLVLVTGPTGSGKTTTLASMINLINDTYRTHHHDRRPDRVLPHHKKSRGQPARDRRRCAGLPGGHPRAPCAWTRTSSWSAKCATWRRSRRPSTAAETGHIVFGTLHTNGASQHGQPHHRRLPGGPAGPDPHAAVAGAHRRPVAGAAAREPEGLVAGLRNDGGHARPSQPDPREQDPASSASSRPAKQHGMHPLDDHWSTWSRRSWSTLKRPSPTRRTRAGSSSSSTFRSRTSCAEAGLKP